jgi:Zn-dependent protease/CBS domain-containing protein
MFGKSITLFKLFGFAVRIDLSWVVILVLVTWSLSAGVFPARHEDLTTGTYWLMGLAAAMGLFLSIVLHELCHSLVARQFGLPMSGITLFMFGGVAEMTDEPPSPKAEFMMAVAGPACSIVLAGLFIGASVLTAQAGVRVEVTAVLRWVGFINGILVAFNMVPGFPLDGGRVLRSILWHFNGNFRKATYAASRAGMAFSLVLIAVGIFNLLFLNPIGGLWWVLIGMFLRGAATQSYQQVLIRQALKGESVRQFMTSDPITVTPSLPLDEFVHDYVYRHHFKMFPVVDDGRLLGCVTTRQVKEVPRDAWADRTVGDVVDGCSDANSVHADADAMDALKMMNHNQVSRVMVVDDGELLGMLSLKDLLEFLSLKLDLEGDVEPPRRIHNAVKAT